ncbi:RagB/SusD family nutrient uptake outer membrane protein [Parabacteroides sp. An277]|uniref:RagB/SusD family nutrient uptake outer membrane protein n=1 Tax=Parabacteroides sp. An277 TaxID=1965619 RepID=UPI000B368B7C|nr:RagB/SusD family nutrient uptake outer membrane protein [Parabacteroides sp. An277]OUO53709.1 RagB/SusD family nutrient uptake outer membrane protein [Parabacteroides sp. An277]
MKRFKNYIVLGMAALLGTSCSDFLDVTPKDALSPSTTWQTETDAEKFAIGCYDGWEDGGQLLYFDCGSDFGYNNFSWEGYRPWGDGTLSASNTGASLYSFTTIRRCNTFLENVEAIPFSDENVKNDLIAQVRFIRAYQYFKMNWWYGGVPIIDNYESAEEAQVPRNTEEEVRTFVEQELDAITPMLNNAPAERGRAAKGAALALRMREALYYEDWATAKDRAQQIIDLGLYSLDPSYTNLFSNAGKDSPEIIMAVQYINNLKGLGVIGQMYNNGNGGWSSIVPTHNLLDTYEMENGMTIDEAGSGYDPVHPFANRDPRMAMSICFPGQDYVKADGTSGIFNTLDRQIDGANNLDYMTMADNTSRTGLTWNKYLAPITQYSNIWDTDACPIVFRYAEVLLSWAEAENELNGPSAEVYNKLNQIRARVGMPEVDQAKYGTQATLRELIRRERGVELAGEGLRRADIVRWKDASGKMVAETVLNGTLERKVGTVSMDASVDPEMRATIDVNASSTEKFIETRKFATYNRYFPIPQTSMDKNPQLTQNDGY